MRPCKLSSHKAGGSQPVSCCACAPCYSFIPAITVTADISTTPDPSQVDEKNVYKDTSEVSSLDPETTKPNAANRKFRGTVTIIGSALANLSDGFQQSLAGNTNVVFDHILTTKVYTSSIQTRISNALLVGSVIGILVFGYTSDRFSRKGGMLVTSGLVVVGTLMSTLAFQVHGAHNIFWYLAIARGAAGVGVGGEYPTSAAAALESSNEHYDAHRGPIQVVISTLQATSGGALCTFVYLMALIGSHDKLIVAFHAMYSIATILPFLVIVARWRMQDGRLFERSNFKKRTIPWTLLVKKYWLRITGTSVCFFLYDFVNL